MGFVDQDRTAIVFKNQSGQRFELNHPSRIEFPIPKIVNEQVRRIDASLVEKLDLATYLEWVGWVIGYGESNPHLEIELEKCDHRILTRALGERVNLPANIYIASYVVPVSCWFCGGERKEEFTAGPSSERVPWSRSTSLAFRCECHRCGFKMEFDTAELGAQQSPKKVAGIAFR